MTEEERYQEYYALAGALGTPTIEAVIADLDGRTGWQYEAIRRAFSDRLENRRRSIDNAKGHGWIK